MFIHCAFSRVVCFQGENSDRKQINPDREMWHGHHHSSSGDNFKVDTIAGAVAGITELCIMYPIDTVKTRMQSLGSRRKGIIKTLTEMMKTEGAFRPIKGMGIIAATAGPAHGIYFASYQYVKNFIQDNTKATLSTAVGTAGAVATFMHDLVCNPAEVIKQRLQMKNTPYKSSIDCALKVFKDEGIGAFYKSFGAQLFMNIPFQVIHFGTYEWVKKKTNPRKSDKIGLHLLNGAIAGGVAAGLTTPLDVIKTLLNTQQEKVSGIGRAAKRIYKVAGVGGFFKGLGPRIVHQAPSNALCWAIYESVKNLLQPRRK